MIPLWPLLATPPVPAKTTACGVSLALSAKFSEALRLPIADGVNVTLTAQVLPDVTVSPLHVSATFEKSPKSVPVIVTVEMTKSTMPVFVIVSVWEELVTPTGQAPKPKVEAERLTMGACLNATMIAP
jgi:hypothetical protein